MHKPPSPSNDLDIKNSNYGFIETKLRDILGKFIPEVTSETINHEGVILHERPQFVYALDIGLSRFPLVMAAPLNIIPSSR